MGYIDQVMENFNKNISNGVDISLAIDEANDLLNNKYNSPTDSISEAEYTKAVNHLKLEILDVDRFVKVNSCRPITNPVFYTRDNIPTDDGLLSNSIFGITKDDRAGIFAYIDLGGWYIDPSCYKNWYKIDSKVKDVVHKNGTFSVNAKGEIIEDPSGKNGVKFLKDNIDKIKFKTSESIKRDLRVQFLEKNRNNMFINKYLVIPPYYRDTNTGKKAVGVGGINKLYSQLLVSINSLKTTQEYGFDLSGPMQGKVQESILAIYDWACGNTNSTINAKDVGVGIGGKMGILRRANMTKTANYSARLVITAPELKSYRPEDMMVDFDKSAIPLAACIACFRSYVQFYVRRFFENEFMGTEQYPVLNKDGTISYETPKDPLIEFSDERIKTEMEKFLHAYNNRMEPIRVPSESDKVVYMQFKGRFKNEVDAPIFHRKLTWCDIFYIATIEAVKDKMAIITRYPVDSRFNEITTEIVVSSTKATEQMYFNNTFYKYYPKIREEDINSNTGNKFVDTLKLSNLYLPGLGADYDGDTAVVKGVYTVEANEELRQFRNSKMNFIDLGAGSIRSSSADVIQSLYSITKVLSTDESKLTAPKF